MKRRLPDGLAACHDRVRKAPIKPADRSVVMSGAYSGLCTNYQISAEFVTRTVFRVEGAPAKPNIIVESYNIMPPD